MKYQSENSLGLLFLKWEFIVICGVLAPIWYAFGDQVMDFQYWGEETTQSSIVVAWTLVGLALVSMIVGILVFALFPRRRQLRERQRLRRR